MADLDISTEQAVAYESASHELGHLVDDIAHALFRIWGEDSVLGILAEESRWAVFLLRDRVATHAVSNVGARAQDLTVRAPAPEELASPRVNRFHAEAELRPALATALSRCDAILAGMAGGYARCCAHTHDLMTALRNARASVSALRAALSSASCFDRSPRPAIPRAEHRASPAAGAGEARPALPPGPRGRARARLPLARRMRPRPVMRWR